MNYKSSFVINKMLNKYETVLKQQKFGLQFDIFCDNKARRKKVE